jgi:hypothetical protein
VTQLQAIGELRPVLALRPAARSGPGPGRHRRSRGLDRADAGSFLELGLDVELADVVVRGIAGDDVTVLGRGDLPASTPGTVSTAVATIWVRGPFQITDAASPHQVPGGAAVPPQ